MACNSWSLPAEVLNQQAGKKFLTNKLKNWIFYLIEVLEQYVMWRLWFSLKAERCSLFVWSHKYLTKPNCWVVNSMNCLGWQQLYTVESILFLWSGLWKITVSREQRPFQWDVKRCPASSQFLEVGAGAHSTCSAVSVMRFLEQWRKGLWFLFLKLLQLLTFYKN